MHIATVFISSPHGLREEVYAAASGPELITLVARLQKKNIRDNNGEVIQLRSVSDLGQAVSPTSLKSIGVRILDRKDMNNEITPNPGIIITHTPMPGFYNRKLHQIGEYDLNKDPDDYSPGRNFED